MTATSDPSIVRLGQTGQILVTDAAARTYVDEYRIGMAEARRELTAHLMQASRPESDRNRAIKDGPELWRRRNRASGVDISARVVREDGMAVVVAVSVRDHVSSGGKNR